MGAATWFCVYVCDCVLVHISVSAGGECVGSDWRICLSCLFSIPLCGLRRRMIRKRCSCDFGCVCGCDHVDAYVPALFCVIMSDFQSMNEMFLITDSSRKCVVNLRTLQSTAAAKILSAHTLLHLDSQTSMTDIHLFLCMHSEKETQKKLDELPKSFITYMQQNATKCSEN